MWFGILGSMLVRDEAGLVADQHRSQDPEPHPVPLEGFPWIATAGPRSCHAGATRTQRANASLIPHIGAAAPS